MTDETNNPEEKPAAPQSPEPTKPTPPDSVGAGLASSCEETAQPKPETPVAPSAAKPAAPKAPETPPPPPPVIGTFGNFLKGKGIEPTAQPLSAGVETMELKAADLPNAIKLLRESSETKLDYLVAVSGVDSADTFDSVYHLWSYTKKDELVVKVRTPKSSVPADQLPEVPSIASFWPTADWHERETYDLVGIRYIGHRYLRRILNPWDWEGHPLRRDYKQPVDALNDKHPDSMR